MTMPSVSIIILAAGKSARMGLPKQLLPMRRTTLLKHTIDEALGSRAHDVRVVIGADAEEVRKKVPERRFRYVMNPKWQEGMSTSIRAGVASLPDDMGAAIISLCDQPFLTSHIFNNLIETFASSQTSIVTCEDNGQIVPPTLFASKHFPELFALKGDTGAKKVVMSHQDIVVRVPFPSGSIDLDTPEDYRSFLQKEFGM